MVSFKNTFPLEVFQRVVDGLLFISDDNLRLLSHDSKKLLKNVRIGILAHATGDHYSENYYFLVGIAASKNSKHILGMALCFLSLLLSSQGLPRMLQGWFQHRSKKSEHVPGSLHSVVFVAVLFPY